jgi:hypothetical protein
MPRTLLLTVIVTILTGSLLTWACAADGPTPAVEQLIDRLGSADFNEREQAAKTLKAGGPDVLPALRKALTHRDAEVRRRVEELIPQLEAIAAVAPKRVTLSAEKQPLSAILKDIEKQTGYKVEEIERNDDKRYSIKLKDASFWDALEQISREAGCVVVGKWYSQELLLKPSKAPARHVVLSDSFRLELLRAQEDRVADFREPASDKPMGKRTYRLTFDISVMLEPKHQLLGIEQAQVEVARLNDKSQVTASPKLPLRELMEFRGRRDLGQEVPDQAEIRLERQAGTATSLKEITGSIPVHIVTARKDVIVTDKFLESEGTKFRCGNDELQIITAKLDRKLEYQLRIAVPDEDGVERHWRARIHLEDAKGNRYKPTGFGSVSSGGKDQLQSFYYAISDDPNIGPPVKVVVEDWTIIRHSIPFTFKDVPLP